MIKILGLDFETSDAKPLTTNITEVGAVLVEVTPGTLPGVTDVWNKLASFSEFCYEPDYTPQTQKIIDLTGITDDMLKTSGRPRSDVFIQQLLPLVHAADIIVMHKSSFDWEIFKAQCKRMGVTPPEKEILCTLTNFNWHPKYTCKKLGHLAWEHGIDVKAKDLHRAENDVDLMLRLISMYKINDVLAYARTPWVYLKADILGPWLGKGGDGGVQKEIATGLGFSYETTKGSDFPKWPKTWVNRVKPFQLEEIQSTVLSSVSPFRVSVIEGLS